jgi:hypothetical protein
MRCDCGFDKWAFVPRRTEFILEPTYPETSVRHSRPLAFNCVEKLVVRSLDVQLPENEAN